jgi:hypothetical protein
VPSGATRARIEVWFTLPVQGVTFHAAAVEVAVEDRE